MKIQQIWFAVDVTLTPQAVEAVENALSEAGASGTEFSTLGIKEIREIVSVTGYFDESPNLEIVKAEIENALMIYNLPAESVKGISAREVENKDWLAEWKKNWKPTETGKFIIAPVWSNVETDEKIVIRIEPSMAFGTGTHETTRLCLRTIEEIYAGESFFDVGTGTGILAIAAAKLNLRSQISKSKLFACDTDVDSVALAKENAELNKVTGMVDFVVGSISAETTEFDFVCANLTLDVIEPLLPMLLQKARKMLLLSGILVEQRVEIVRALAGLGVHDPEVNEAGEWISVLVQVKNEK
jgi:ribosomal protein L11 methyltransferase